jgi:DNA-binding NtrC family response regulator
MSVPRSTVVVADDDRLADSVLARLAEAGLGPVLRTTPTECREQQLWARPADFLLLTGSPEDFEPVAAVAQGCRLQGAATSVIVLHAGATARQKEYDQLAPYVSARLPWPEGAVSLPKVLADRPTGRPEYGPPDGLAARVASFTPSLLPLVKRLATAAAHDVTVLLTGETGTGKTYLARLLHEFSPRRQHPFLAVPCGSQPANLFESSFFGHVRGSFTGADQTRKGKFAAVGKGTLLLDEIDTLALEQLASLLRVIETGEYEPVGGNETQRSEARIIAASNWDLEEAVEQGRFRQDLYYRLSIVPFHLPPLRERPADIPPLARTFAAAFNTKYRKGLFDIRPEAMAALRAFPWPGNIRQLEHVLQQAVLMSTGPELAVEDLPETVQRYAGTTPPLAPAAPAEPRANGESLLQSRADHERRLIQRTLEEYQQNRSRAAKALGISRVTLHKKIKQYKLQDGGGE